MQPMPRVAFSRLPVQPDIEGWLTAPGRVGFRFLGLPLLKKKRNGRRLGRIVGTTIITAPNTKEPEGHGKASCLAEA